MGLFFLKTGKTAVLQNPVVKRRFYKIAAAVLTAAILFPAAGCASRPPIGDLVYNVFDTPITALMFEKYEEDGDTGYGVVYREVNDIDKLIAGQDVPVVIVFMDGMNLSDEAIAFTEELCDRFADDARIVRVNVNIGENTAKVDELVSLFNIADYPWFSICYKGELKYSISGFSAGIEEEIEAAVRKAAE